MLPWRTATGWPSTSASTSTSAPTRSTQGARMKTAWSGPSGQASSASKEASWRPNALRRTVTSSRPRCSESSMISPAQVPSTGRPERAKRAQRLGEPLALHAERDRGGLAAGDHQPVEPLEVGGHAHAARLRAQLGRALCACASKPPWRASTPIAGGRYQPRFWSRPPSASSVPISMPGIASPSSRDAAATRSASS